MQTTFVRAPAAKSEEVTRLRAIYPQLPESYLSFLQQSNGAEGHLGIEPGWFIVWPAAEALVATVEYELRAHLPGHFAFGGNGGGELFVFKLHPSGTDGKVFMVPAIGMSEAELQVVASSFGDFQGQMGKGLA